MIRIEYIIGLSLFTIVGLIFIVLPRKVIRFYKRIYKEGYRGEENAKGIRQLRIF